MQFETAPRGRAEPAAAQHGPALPDAWADFALFDQRADAEVGCVLAQPASDISVRASSRDASDLQARALHAFVAGTAHAATEICAPGLVLIVYAAA